MDREGLKRQLIVDEGERLFPYTDSVGKLTIGVGHNLTDNGLSKEIVDKILDDDISQVERHLDLHFPWWRKMDEQRQNVLANMCFNMGIGVLSTFRNTLSAMESGDYQGAADGMKHSRWASQVGVRADRLIAIMRG